MGPWCDGSERRTRISSYFLVQRVSLPMLPRFECAFIRPADLGPHHLPDRRPMPRRVRGLPRSSLGCSPARHHERATSISLAARPLTRAGRVSRIGERGFERGETQLVGLGHQESPELLLISLRGHAVHVAALYVMRRRTRRGVGFPSSHARAIQSLTAHGSRLTRTGRRR